RRAGEGLRRDEELIALLLDDIIVGDGDDKDEDNGHEAEEGDNGKDDIKRDIGSGLDAVELFQGTQPGIFPRFAHNYVPPSRQIRALALSNLRTTALAVRIMIQPTTDWNMDAADVQPMLVVGEVSIRNTFTS